MVEAETRNAFASGGETRVGYTKDGQNLVVGSSNGLVRVFKIDQEDAEPNSIDILEGISNLCVYSNDKFAVCSKEGEAAVYSIEKNDKIATVIRSSLPLRDVTFTHNGAMLASAGDDTEVQIADLRDSSRIIKFKVDDQVHDLSYNPSIDLMSISLSNGDVKIYSLSSEVPNLVATLNDVIPKLFFSDEDEDDDEELDSLLGTDANSGNVKSPKKKDNQNLITARVEWHPNGDFFAIPSSNNTIKIFSRNKEYDQVYSFMALHEKPLTCVKWSPDGKFLASADLNNKLVIWDFNKKESIYDSTLENQITNISWRKNPQTNGLDVSIGSNDGDFIIMKNIVSFKLTQQVSASNNNTGLNDLVSNEAQDAIDSEDEEKNADDINLNSDISNDLDNPNAVDFDANDDGFIEDDDGQGYVSSKRPYGDGDDDEIDGEDDDNDDDGLFGERSKQPRLQYSKITNKFKLKPYSQGCTQYISGRRYLTMNSIGYVSSVEQDTHSSITVSFFDTSVHKEYHFEDPYKYDLASLTEEGLLLAKSKDSDGKAKILFKNHESNADNWVKDIQLKSNEFLTTVSLSESNILICTSLGNLRILTTYGLPIGLQKISPIIASATNSNYIFTISISNNNQLIYNLQDLDGNFIQRDLSLPIELDNVDNSSNLFRGIFFSSYGDPILMGQDGTLLVLSRWRNALQARWIPILDSETSVKELGAVGKILVWPLGLHGDQLNCILVKGSNYPTHPLPPPSELPVKLLLTSDPNEEDEHEEILLRSRVLGELLGETLSNEGEVFENDNEKLAEYANLHDTSIIKLFASSCSNDNISKAWKLIKELKQDQALVACHKISERLGLVSLANRITKLREQKMEMEMEMEMNA